MDGRHGLAYESLTHWRCRTLGDSDNSRVSFDFMTKPRCFRCQTRRFIWAGIAGRILGCPKVDFIFVL